MMLRGEDDMVTEMAPVMIAVVPLFLRTIVKTEPPCEGDTRLADATATDTVGKVTVKRPE
jgi:hypothetical protein